MAFLPELLAGGNWGSIRPLISVLEPIHFILRDIRGKKSDVCGT
jgi:hypothetical protein